MNRPGPETLEQLAAGTIDHKAFSHRDHIAAAYAALQGTDFFDALRTVDRGLRQLTIKAGVPEKYSATVTFAFMSLIGERMHAGTYRDDHEFIERNSDLMDPTLLSRWYTPDRLSSPLARACALLPDPR